MRTKYIFVNWSGIRIKGEVSASKIGLSPNPAPRPSQPHNFPTDRFTAVPLLQFFFVCASVVLYVAFVLSLFVTRLVSPSFGALLRLCFVIVAFPDITKTYLYNFYPLKPHFYI